ncbi:MAG: DUF29 domain-containing protein [Snowella sp.]|nr:DUF29 domain-containing protein [Snowella sp.]
MAILMDQKGESSSLYDQDFQLWIEQTIKQLENSDFEQLDRQHLIEELADLGKSEKRALESNLMILLAHLLKLKVQSDAPAMMQQSWLNSVDENRKRIQKSLKATPSLNVALANLIESAYPDAYQLAIKEGKRAKLGVNTPDESAYPMNCPFSITEILDEDFYGV